MHPTPRAPAARGVPRVSLITVFSLPNERARARPGVGDVVAIDAPRARWNAFDDAPELATGHAAEVTVLLDASGVLARAATLASFSRDRALENDVPERERAINALCVWASATRSSLLLAARDARECGGGVTAAEAAFCAAETLHARRSAHFLGRVVAATTTASASASTAARADEYGIHSIDAARAANGAATLRPVLWLAQREGGTLTEVTLPPRTYPSAAIAAEAAAEEFEGRVVEILDAVVRYRGGSDRYGLVCVENVSAWRVLRPREDDRAVDVLERCGGGGGCYVRAEGDRRSSRGGRGATTTLRELRRGSAGGMSSRASIARVVARVRWVQLPRPRRTATGGAKKRGRDDDDESRGGGGGGGASAPAPAPAPAFAPSDVAAALLAYGCTSCHAPLMPDARDGIYPQCACHHGGVNTTGYVWRGVTLGLVDADVEADVEADVDDDAGNGRGTATPCVLGGELMRKLLFGIAPGDAAWSSRRRGTRLRSNRGDAEDDLGVDVEDEEEDEEEEDGDGDEEGFPRSRAAGADALEIATAALNALARGGERNAPFSFKIKTPRLDENGVPENGPLEIVAFDV